MRKSRFSEEQIVAILREADRTSVADAAKKHKVSEQTLYVWRKHFAGLAPADVKRLKALELENNRLKHVAAAQALDIAILKEAARGNGSARPGGGRPWTGSARCCRCRSDGSARSWGSRGPRSATGRRWQTTRWP